MRLYVTYHWHVSRSLLIVWGLVLALSAACASATPAPAPTASPAPPVNFTATTPPTAAPTVAPSATEPPTASPQPSATSAPFASPTLAASATAAAATTSAATAAPSATVAAATTTAPATAAPTAKPAAADFTPAQASVWDTELVGPDAMQGTCSNPVTPVYGRVLITPQGNTMIWKNQEPAPYTMMRVRASVWQYSGPTSIGDGTVTLVVQFTSATTLQLTRRFVSSAEPACTHVHQYTGTFQWNR